MSNSFGTAFRITTFGESHGEALGVVIDGCPPNIPIDVSALQTQINRRRPGQSAITTSRNEKDKLHIVSGIFEGITTGTPIAVHFYNEDQHSKDYDSVASLYRPGHADLTYDARYGIRDHRGGGRASARETIARVAAGAIAQQFRALRFGIEIMSWVQQIGSILMPPMDFETSSIDKTPIRCPAPDIASKMMALIEKVQEEGDTIGGAIATRATGVPQGWGAPVFDKLEAELAKAMMSIPACKGFEIGSGFGGIKMRGSAHNDAFTNAKEGVVSVTNHAGGTLGGISSGAPLEFRCAFKPVSTHFKPQQTVTKSGAAITFTNEGRHDPCVVPRAVPIVEAMTALVLADHALRTAQLLRKP